MNRANEQDPLSVSTDSLCLLAKRGNLEIMKQHLVKGATAWLVPSDTPDDIEFFYILKGEVSFENLDGNQVLSSGDSFFIRDLDGEVLMRTQAESEILYVSTMPVFDDNFEFQMELSALLNRVGAKDDYTEKHSRNVMRYCILLRQALGEYCSGSMQDIVVASLFHDVGKCKIDDSILKKRGSLTKEEYAVMQQHPIESAKLLKTHYNDRIVEIARNHHERLDGSGYPNHLMADQLSFEARIVAVADSFDAMTTNRGYNRVKSAEAAASELLGMNQQYDERVTSKLLEMIQSGELHLL